MAEPTNNELKNLQEKLDLLLTKQAQFSNEIQQLQLEMTRLKLRQFQEEKLVEKAAEPREEITIEPAKISEPVRTSEEEKATEPLASNPFDREGFATEAFAQNTAPKKGSWSFDFSKTTEAFIGGNLINKIGIAITVIGVGIGAKYSIDHNLINPIYRLIMGYAVGLGLLGFAFKLKPKYPPFSAVLLGGSMAIMYFLTYLGYDLYDLIPHMAAFGLMLVFTAFTVFAATQYNLVIIAHLGLLGAYSVPFLLSNNSGKVEALFTYMFIVNAGIMILAYKRAWRSLNIPAFVLTWLIYLGWYFQESYNLESAVIPLVFSSLFFLLFYSMFMAQVIKNHIKLAAQDTVYLLTNAMLYYVAGYSALHVVDGLEQYKGVFTVINAAIHFGVAFYLFKIKRTETPAFNLVMGVVLIFITLAIPVQLEGKFITIMWIAEAAVLTWVAQKSKLKVFDRLSYPVLALGIISLLGDWSTGYSFPEDLNFLINTEFLNSVLAISALGVIYFLKKRNPAPISAGLLKDVSQAMVFLLPLALIGFSYGALMLELDVYFKVWTEQTAITVGEYSQHYDPAIELFQQFWSICFSLVFVLALYIIHHFSTKKQLFTQFLFVINGLAILAFLVFGLFNISEMRDMYLSAESELFTHPFSLVYLRYVGLAFFAIPLFIAHKLSRDEELTQWVSSSKHLLLHTIVLWLLSSELLHWLSIYGSENQYKLALSILWGCYALFIVVIGLWKRRKLLRFGGIALFTITLVKLFFYDISHLGTISKTIVFVSLGVLLLIVSFLYNKYKDLIDDEPNA
jgi:uncharacterized membrane protein